MDERNQRARDYLHRVRDQRREASRAMDRFVLGALTFSGTLFILVVSLCC